jgi:predicted N-acyltransferase
MAASSLRIIGSIGAIAAEAWDACAGSTNPFVSHGFLLALEESGSVGGGSGWRVCHALLDGTDGRPIAAAPLYLKSHSYGEYVFDHGWAQAYERAGGRYYPKLLSAVPFSPVPGPRLLVRPDAPPGTEGRLIEGLVALARESGVSSLHITFPTAPEWDRLGSAGLLQRIGEQFHWTNDGYGCFDDFLGNLASRKRKNLRKERAAAIDGIDILTLEGGAIRPHHWDAFYRFYRATVDRKWGEAYLKRGFFDLLSARLGDRVVLMLAERNGRPIAGALNLRGEDTLYGRNWGCEEDVPFLHFELCYYRAIDYAIAHGLKRVEAGAQGMHKIQRGYLPAETYSAHWIGDSGLRRAVSRFLDQERPAIRAQMAELASLSPFRRGDPGAEE